MSKYKSEKIIIFLDFSQIFAYYPLLFIIFLLFNKEDIWQEEEVQ